VSAGLVALCFRGAADVSLRLYVWWWPRDQVATRIRTISSSTLVRALRVGPVDAVTNPPELLQALEAELTRRRLAGEWTPNLTKKEVAQWSAAPSAAGR
jgi:hypothetical protein